MKLKDWMGKNKVSYRKLSVDIDVSYTTVYNLLFDKRPPRADIIDKVIAYTKGEVGFDDLMEKYRNAKKLSDQRAKRARTKLSKGNKKTDSLAPDGGR